MNVYLFAQVYSCGHHRAKCSVKNPNARSAASGTSIARWMISICGSMPVLTVMYRGCRFRARRPRIAKRCLNALYELAKPLVMRSRPVHAPTPGAAHKLLVGVPGALGNQRGDFML